MSGSGYPPSALAAGQLGAAALTLWLAAPFVARGEVLLTATVVASILALGAIGTGVAYLLYYRLIADAGPTSTSMVTYLIPVVAVALGVIVLREPIGWNVFVGAAVVILGVAVAEGRLTMFPPRQAARPPVGSSGRSADDPVQESVARGG